MKNSNARIIKGFSIFVCLGFLLLGLLLLKLDLLKLIFADIDLERPDVLWRIHYIQISFLAAGYLVLFLGWLLTKIPGFANWPEHYIGMIVSGGLTVFLLLSSEAIAATRYEPIYFPQDPNIVARAIGATFLHDDYLGHVLNPGSKTPYVINSLGFRGQEFPRQKEKNEFRIVIIGDSITFGWGIKNEAATYPYYLQQFLQAQSRGESLYRVINAGVPSYTSLQAKQLLEQRILSLEPDLIIVMIGWNDLAYSFRSNWYPEISLDDGGKSSFTPALLGLARDLMAPAQTQAAGDNVPNPQGLKAYQLNLEGIIDLAGSHQIKVLLTNLPTILSRQGNTPEELEKAKAYPKVENVQLFQRIIDDVCASYESQTVHCVHDIFGLEEANKNQYFYDHCHPYDKGNYQIALRLLKALQQFQ